jgi:hypothetical protein
MLPHDRFNLHDRRSSAKPVDASGSQGHVSTNLGHLTANVRTRARRNIGRRGSIFSQSMALPEESRQKNQRFRTIDIGQYPAPNETHGSWQTSLPHSRLSPKQTPHTRHA